LCSLDPRLREDDKKGSGPAMTLIMLINHFLTTPYS